MTNRALALAVTLSLTMSTTAFAAVNYQGEKISDNYGPNFVVENSVATAYPDDQKSPIVTKNAKQITTTKKTGIKAGESGETAAQAALPITLYGDHVVYHQDSGEFTANGNVRIYQGKQELYTTLVEGNMKTGDVYMKRGGRVVEGETSTTGQWAHYNFTNKNGEIKKLSGTSGPDIYRSEEGTIYPDRIELKKGAVTTRCPAIHHSPCLEIRAGKVVIYPGDKLIAYDVKVYVKGKHIYSRDRLISKLSEKEKQGVIIPHIGYTSEHGMELEYNYEHVFSPNDTANADMRYYTKIGWRPMYSFNHDAKNFYVKVQNGYDEDNDNNWIKKQTDILVGYKSHKFSNKLPLNYSMYYEHGLWSDNTQKSWHTAYGVFINHDRIHFGGDKTTFLDLGIGHKWVNESLTDNTMSTMLYKATLGKGFKYGWDTWLGYYWQRNQNEIFNYDASDMAEEVQFGLKKTFDENNNLAVITRYDKSNSSLYNYTVRYTHNFCCWRLIIEYIDQRYKNDHEWNIRYDLVRW